jgi:hypothetical protein
MSSLRHKYLVSMLGYAIAGTERIIVLEFCKGGNLFQALHGKCCWSLGAYEASLLIFECASMQGNQMLAASIHYLTFSCCVAHHSLSSSHGVKGACS